MTKEQQENQEKWDESMIKVYNSVIKTIEVYRGIIEDAEKLKSKDPKANEYVNALIERTKEAIAHDEIWIDNFRKTLNKLPSIK